jgi:CBS-domain-containing membrane protein
MVKQIITSKPTTISSKDCTIGVALAALETELHNDVTYAVVDEHERFEGTLSLVQLLKLIDATIDGQELQHQPLEAAEAIQRSKTKAMCEADAGKVMERCRSSDALAAPLALGPVVNTSSYCVNEKMSILRAYSLFRTMGCRHMVVVDIGNRVVGVLTRHDLVDVCHPPHHGHDHGGGGGGGHAEPAAVVPSPVMPTEETTRTAPLLANRQ